MTKTARSIDVTGLEGNYMTGVFRWRPSHPLRTLPLSSYVINSRYSSLDYNSGYIGFFASRCQQKEELDALLKYVHSDLCLVDSLSFPLSICFGLLSSKIIEERMINREVLHLVCLGCTGKAEERVMRETNCFDEIVYAFPNIKHIHVYLVGPEMTVTESDITIPLYASNHENIQKELLNKIQLERRRMKYHTFKGTSRDFFKAHSSLLPIATTTTTSSSSASNGGGTDTVCIGFNCGFGNFDNLGSNRYDLFASWYADLSFLTAIQNMPCIFTCANDYSDLKGELAILLQCLGSQLVSLPTKSEYHCASTFVSEESASSSSSSASSASQQDYSCGNSFLYVVQGNIASRRKHRKLPVYTNSNKYTVLHTFISNHVSAIWSGTGGDTQWQRMVVGGLITPGSYKSPVRSNASSVHTALDTEIVKIEPEEKETEKEKDIESLSRDINQAILGEATFSVPTQPATTTTTTATAKDKGGNTLTPGMPPTIRTASAILTREEFLSDSGRTVHQSLTANLLTVTIMFPDATDFSGVNAYLNQYGNILHIESSSSSPSSSSPSLQEVTLMKTCSNANMGASLSKRKKTLTITLTTLASSS